MFNLPKADLTMLLENLGDSQVTMVNNGLVQVSDRQAELFAQQGTNRGFTAAHKAD